MTPRFSIEIDWERLDAGSEEVRATFGAIGLRVDGVWLSEAHDQFVNRVRQKVHLSGYLLAHWLSWNWWRLLWEPRRSTLSWKMAHRLSNIGGGYVWPNIDCITDGARILLQATPTRSTASEPLRYVAEVDAVIEKSEFECGAEQFVERILEQLRAEGIAETQLSSDWAQLQDERRDRNSSWYRRLEASMGYDPDEADEGRIEALIAEASELGRNGIAELAAGVQPNETIPGARELREIADGSGHDVDLGAIPELALAELERSGSGRPAWFVATAVARELRRRAGLGAGRVTDESLAELAGVSADVLQPKAVAAPFSYALNGEGRRSRVVLQTPIATNRRFALARMIGDRILARLDEPLIPIMRSYSFRQKRQRAFAAELLCPVEQVVEELDAERSDESQERVAAEYKVSPMLVRTQLVNAGLIERQSLNEF